MSDYYGNDEMCPACGLKYRELHTGLTYQDVFLMLWVPDTPEKPTDASGWRYKKRNTVLGKWHQIKQEMWCHHLTECQGPPEGWDEDEEVG